MRGTFKIKVFYNLVICYLGKYLFIIFIIISVNFILMILFYFCKEVCLWGFFMVFSDIEFFCKGYVCVCNI